MLNCPQVCDKCSFFFSFFFSFFMGTVWRMVFIHLAFRETCHRGTSPNKLNDSVISVICLKAGSITQACRTADEQHFYIAHNSAALLFIASACPRASTDPTFQSAARLNCLENYHLCQGLSFVLIYSVLTLRWLFPRPKVPSWRKCVLIAQVLALRFIVSALWLLWNAAKKIKKERKKLCTASPWTERDHFHISNVGNTTPCSFKDCDTTACFFLFSSFFFSMLVLLKLGAVPLPELLPNIWESGATRILHALKYSLTW